MKFHHSDSMKTGKTALRYPLYGSDDEMAQKVIDGDNDTYQHIISYASDFEMTQNSNHLFSLYFGDKNWRCDT